MTDTSAHTPDPVHGDNDNTPITSWSWDTVERGNTVQVCSTTAVAPILRGAIGIVDAVWETPRWGTVVGSTRRVDRPRIFVRVIWFRPDINSLYGPEGDHPTWFSGDTLRIIGKADHGSES